MSHAFVLEAANAEAGIIVREHGGYRFFAAGRRFGRLDRHLFRSVAAAQRAIEGLAAIKA